MAERDSQRQKVYNAEREALIPLQKSIPSVKDVEKYTKKVFSRATIKKRFGNKILVRGVDVSDGRGCRNAMAYGGSQIVIPVWARNDRVILHELAHIIHNRIIHFPHYAETDARKFKTGASHGWEFCAIYLTLVRFMMGVEAEKALKASFKKHRVRYKPKRIITKKLPDDNVVSWGEFDKTFC